MVLLWWQKVVKVLAAEGRGGEREKEERFGWQQMLLPIFGFIEK